MNKLEILENGNVRVTIPIALRSCSGRKKIVAPGTVADDGEPLALTLARAFRWQRYIDEGKFKNTTELALAVGRDKGSVARTVRLTLLSPEIVHKILSCDIPQGLTLSRLREGFPELWEEQMELLCGE